MSILTSGQIGRLKDSVSFQGADSSLDIVPPIPFVIRGREVLYFTATSDTNNIDVGGRFSGELVRDQDA